MVDPYSSYVVLLIPFDSTNQFKDESLFNHLIEFDGTPAIQDIGSKWENGCLALDANGQIKIADANSLSLESNNFTFEFWVKFSGFPLVGEYFDFFSKYDYDVAVPEYRFSLHNDSGTLELKFSFTDDGISTTRDFTDPWTPTIDVWYHVAVSRSGINFYFFVNGVRYGSVKTGSESIFNTTQRMSIGNSAFKGCIQDFRATRGISRHTSDFSIQDEPFVIATDFSDPWYESVSLLLPMDSEAMFTDHSPIISAVTRFGDTKILTTQSKWGNGSAYFDGTGDYLQIPNSTDFNFGSGDFTIECWVCPTQAPSPEADIVTSNGASNGCGLRLGGNLFAYFIYSIGGTTSHVPSTQALPLNQWTHLAAVRFGSSAYLFVNGVPTSKSCGAGSQNYPGIGFCVGRNNTNSSWYFTGYIDELRITKGVARYTSNFALQNRSLVQNRTLITNGQCNEIQGRARLNQIDSMKKLWILSPGGFLVDKLSPDDSGNFITKCVGNIVWCGFPFDPERWVGLHATNTAYLAGDIVIEYPDESAVVLECITAGTTNPEKSVLSRIRGAEIFDGTVVWKSLGILSNNIPRFNFAIA